jgi:hypothetical protein
MTAAEVLPILLGACPTAQAVWEEHCSWWENEPAGGFNDVAVFAHHIVNSYATDKLDEFPAFFAALERLIVEGDEETVGLAVVGVIEGIQNVASHQPFGYAVFEKWLRPRSREEWAQIEAAWSGSNSLAQVIRKERM